MVTIYQILCITECRAYVGSTKVKFSTRKSQHLSELKLGYHPNKPLQKDYDKHGSGDFIFTVLEKVKNKDRKESEQYWISQQEAYYNIRMNGNTKQ